MIEILLSSALNDSKISLEEFANIITEKNIYENIKENIKELMEQPSIKEKEKSTAEPSSRTYDIIKII